jgi:hypothetical protein
MRRLLRLLALCVFALALSLQGALAATAMGVDAGAHPKLMNMPDGQPMAAADMPCHDHAPDKTGCGDCCGPIVAQRALLAVAPVAARWAALPRRAADVAPALFLTGGTERPPRRLLAQEAPLGRA